MAEKEGVGTCPICLDILSDSSGVNVDVVESRCGHSAHRLCLQEYIRKGLYHCPLCRHAFGDIATTTSAIDTKTSLSKPVVVDKAMLRYSKMLQAKLSPAVVRQRMVVDNIPTDTIDAFFTAGMSTSLRTPEQEVEALEAHARQVQAMDLSKYEKLLSVGMTEGAIRQKMSLDKIPNEVIEKFFS